MPLSSIDTGSQVCNLVWSKNLNEIVTWTLSQVGIFGDMTTQISIIWKGPWKLEEENLAMKQQHMFCVFLVYRHQKDSP